MLPLLISWLNVKLPIIEIKMFSLMSIVLPKEMSLSEQEVLKMSLKFCLQKEVQ